MPLCSFDIVTCCDVLEHVEDLERVVSGIGRVLAPGGVFFYDTVNGTMQSRVMMKVMQDWVRVAPKDLHDWARFITPDELRRLLARHGLENREPRGLQPTGNPLAMFPLVRKLKRGEITYAEMGRRTAMQPGKQLAVSYMG